MAGKQDDLSTETNTEIQNFMGEKRGEFLPSLTKTSLLSKKIHSIPQLFVSMRLDSTP